jgi:putative nucleotidyltransferase-like protein
MTPANHRAALLDLIRLEPVRRGVSAYADVDWAAVLAHAGTSLAPLVLRGLEEVGPGVAPAAVRDALRESQQRVAMGYLLRRKAFGEVCATLDAASVPFIALKGAALAYLVYPDPLLRPMSDVDLWVVPDRIDRALEALAARGWRRPAPDSLEAAAAQEANPCEWALYAGHLPTRVELHTRVESLDGLSIAQFTTACAASEEADLGGVRARVLSPEHQLTHVCLHLARANLFRSGLGHLVDVARITDCWSDRWDWPRMLDDWRRERVSVWMLLALVLARDLLGAGVPAGLEHTSRADGWPAMRSMAEDLLWDSRSHALPPAVTALVRKRSMVERLAWIRFRLIDHYWRSPVPLSPVAALREAWRRLVLDLRVKVPWYARAWRRGALGRTALDHGLELERGRTELARLVAAAEGPGSGLSADHTIAATPSVR